MAKRKITVAAPDTRTEKLIPLVDSAGGQDACAILKARGIATTRSSIHRWTLEGMPVRRGGPRIVLPTVFFRNRRMTSVEAVARFLKAVSDRAGK